jgi:protein transport protein SEC24
MMVMTDLEEPFVPLSEGLFVDPYESKYVRQPITLPLFTTLTAENRSVISSLLDHIPAIFSHIKNTESGLLPTLNAALSALQPTGGKIVCALASLPTWGPGKLSEQRDDRSLHGTDGERKLYTTEDAAWKKTASKMAETGVGVDFFIASPGGAYTDVATIGMFGPHMKVI